MLRLAAALQSGILIACAVVASGRVANAETTVCTLTFGMRGYSAQFEESQGRGKVVCSNGQTTTVMVLGRGANLKDGQGAFENGTATFSAVLDISAVLGSFALPPAARVGGVRPLGVAGALTNGEATLRFPLTGPSAKFPATFGRIAIIAHSLSY